MVNAQFVVPILITHISMLRAVFSPGSVPIPHFPSSSRQIRAMPTSGKPAEVSFDAKLGFWRLVSLGDTVDLTGVYVLPVVTVNHDFLFFYAIPRLIARNGASCILKSDNSGHAGNLSHSLRLWFQQLTPNDMVLGLIMANAAVFMLWQIADRRFMVENFMISLDNFRSGRIHTLITSAFSHMDIEHLLSNMIGLYFFGVNIAENFGPKYLLKLYLCGAVGGSVLYLLHHYLMALSSKEQGIWKRDPSRTPGLGASGAVNAIMLLEIFLNPRATIMFDFIIPVPAMLLGVFLIGKDVWRIVQGDSNISGSAHLGGAAVAGLAWYQIRRGRF
ncbi:unnamed protein product [Linum tenue]|uniref:Peptidase S54 rhomboid domain-containing protein n=1 Tax=Linum tenue TaxID=586396 RepID=A0AAV0RSW3_9ROSI|nr:unnamed protein product [Linum tenue]